MKSKPKHIMHLMPYQAVGGTETAALRIAEVARNAGYLNSFLCLEGFPNVSNFFKDKGFNVIEHPEIQPSIRHGLDFLSVSKKMASLFSEQKVDLLHAQDFSAAFSYALTSKLSRIPLISHVRNKHDNISKRDRQFVRGVKHWLFVSKESRDHFSLKTTGGISTVFYDGVKIEEIDKVGKDANRHSVFEEFGLSSDTKLIGMIARVAPQKDFFTLADAILKFSKENDRVKVIVVGDTDNEQSTRDHFKKVSQYIDKLGIAEQFVFTGYRTDVKRLIDALDIHVLSTHFEGFALVNLEVMARAVPAVSTLSDSSLEITEHGKNGLLFEHKNSDDLAQKLLLLISDKDFAERLGAAGFQTVKEKFSHEIFSANLLDFYKRILD